MPYRLREAVQGVAERYRALAPQFNERTRRLTPPPKLTRGAGARTPGN
jgi:hypothetical protein